MAVQAVASVVVQKLTDMLKEEPIIIGKKSIVRQLQDIKNALERMGGYLVDAEKKKDGDENIKEWAEKYLRNLYSVEDAIETFAFRIALRRKRLGFLMNHALFLKNLTGYRRLKRKMRKIQMNINGLNQNKPSGIEDASVHMGATPKVHRTDASLCTDGCNNLVPELVEDANAAIVEDALAAGPDLPRKSPFSKEESVRDRFLQTRLMSSYCYQDDELGLVGFKEQIRDLTSKLTSEADQIIPIYGEMGSGKTTLARAVRTNKEIQNHFQSCFAWVTVGQESTAEEILLNLLKQIGDSKDLRSLEDEKVVKTRLKESLRERRYLIVLDDLRNLDMWEKLSSVFCDHGNGSKIIITTREEIVAETGNRLNMKRLSAEDSWNLFLRKAPVERHPVPDLQKRQILKMCAGLPLNIVLLGSLLSTKEESRWQEVISGPQVWSTMDILALSYNDLPNEQKLCMLYLVLFPKEHDIPVRRLQLLWLAEGFIKRPEEAKNSPEKAKIFPEDVVEKHFDNLVKRSLILISKQRSDGGHRKCRLLGALHEHLFSKALDIKLFHVHRNSDCHEQDSSFSARRLVEYVDSKKCSLDPPQLKYLRSYLSFNFQKKDTPSKEVGILLTKMIRNKFGLLRVLDLEGVYKPSLPDNLGDFFNLRYLGLRWTFLDSLPSSVGKLTYLETLDLKHTYVNRLPSSVWKLKHLRHLNLNSMRLDMPVAPLLSLPGLLTLCGLSIIAGDCLVKNGLLRLRDLRELDLTFQLENCEDVLDWVAELTALQQLRLRSKDDDGRPSTLSLKPLSRLEKLSHMNFLGKLPCLLKVNEFPQNLKVLTVAVSELEEDPMPVLGQLKHLAVLRLLANSYLGKKIECLRGGFKELVVLKLWMLKNLEEWELGEEAMEKLEELNIRCCPKLKSVPERLLHQRAFKELILTNMPKEFTNHAERTKVHFSLTVKEYNFTPLPWEQGNDAPNQESYANGEKFKNTVATDVNGCSSSGSEMAVLLEE